MELKGKKIAFLGDSITESYGPSCNENSYWGLIGRQTGAQVFGYGIGGSRIARQHFPAVANVPMERWFVTRVDEMIEDADIVVIFGGTNDFGHGDAPMGCMTDRTDDTFYGAYHNLIVKLINRYPRAKIVIMTPLHRTTEDDVSLNELGVRRAAPLSGYVDAILEVAGYYGLPVVDLFHKCPIQPNVPILKEMYTIDGLHPNDAGHELIAACLLRELNAL